jgi:hypothetical protein
MTCFAWREHRTAHVIYRSSRIKGIIQAYFISPTFSIDRSKLRRIGHVLSGHFLIKIFEIDFVIVNARLHVNRFS